MDAFFVPRRSRFYLMFTRRGRFLHHDVVHAWLACGVSETRRRQVLGPRQVLGHGGVGVETMVSWNRP